MDILNTFTLKSNRQIKINFNGGDLSSDAGLLSIKEFAAKTGFTRLIKKNSMELYQIIRFDCSCGRMEHFIKKGKREFDFAAVSRRSKAVNANRVWIHMLAYH